MGTTLLERIRPALPVATAFWKALADDEDEALAPLLSPTWDDRPPAFAKLYRDHRGLAPETCRVLGLATVAYLLAADRIRLYFSIVGADSIPFHAGERLTAWRLELVEVGGRWLVDRTTDRESIQTIELEPLFAADTPRSARRRAAD